MKNLHIKNYLSSVIRISLSYSILSAIPSFYTYLVQPDPVGPLERLFVIANIFFLSFIAFFILLIFIDKSPAKIILKANLESFTEKYILVFWALTTVNYLPLITSLICRIFNNYPLFLDHNIVRLSSIPLIIPILISIYRWVSKTKEAKKLIIETYAAYIILVLVYILFITLTRSVDSFEKMAFFAKCILIAISGLLMLLLFRLLYLILFHIYDKALYYKNKPFFRSLADISILLALLSFLGIASFFIWDYAKYRSEFYRELSQYKRSDAKTDINVIIILCDALRLDHLGCYGYQRNTSPYIDSFAKEALIFKNCYAPASNTKPSIASLFTSTYPSTHKAISSQTSALPKDIPCIAEVLQKEGYVTYAYIDNVLLKRVFGFNRGFDFFEDYLLTSLRAITVNILKRTFPLLKMVRRLLPQKLRKSPQELTFRDLKNKRMMAWLKKHKDQNFFMYVHYMYTHEIYFAPPPYNKMFPCAAKDDRSKEVSLYDGSIRFLDERIKDLIETFKSLGIYDKTMIIIMADHGEGFGEHGLYLHGNSIYQELVKIPLIIKYPDSLGPYNKIVVEPVTGLDIMPTILDVLDIKYSGHLYGISLLPLSKGEDANHTQRAILIDYYRERGNSYSGLIKYNTWKYIIHMEEEELYNLKEDPKELNNLASKKPEILNQMRRELALYKKDLDKSSVTANEVKLDEETIQQIRALGYMN